MIHVLAHVFANVNTFDCKGKRTSKCDYKIIREKKQMIMED